MRREQLGFVDQKIPESIRSKVLIIGSDMLGFSEEIPRWSSPEPMSLRARRPDSLGESARAHVAELFGACWKELI